jgi:uncharacterized protein YqhQ
MSSSPVSKEDIHIGGQAVIEGVMMRGRDSVATAVRKPDKGIAIKKESSARWTSLNKFYSLPFIRGVITLAETLTLGIGSLTYSAELAGGEDEKLSKNEIAISLILSVLISIGLFIAVPAYIFTRLKSLPISTIELNLIEGAIRISIFLGFLVFVTLMPDMKRVFEYHGAEHKTINAYDELKSKPGFTVDQLNVETISKYSRIHPSCGTSFLLMVLIVSILTFSFIGRPSFLLRIGLKLLLMPVVAGIAYEMIRLARTNRNSAIARTFSAPGMWLQRLTTREPDPSQIEVAVTALKAVL